MPQITVTLDEMTYMDLVHNLPKGMKSAFVNTAVREAIDLCEEFGGAMHAFARGGTDAALVKVAVEKKYRNINQRSLRDYDETELNEE